MKVAVFAIFTLHFLLPGCDKIKNNETKSGKELELFLRICQSIHCFNLP